MSEQELMEFAIGFIIAGAWTLIPIGLIMIAWWLIFHK